MKKMKKYYMAFLMICGLFLAGCGEKKEQNVYQLYYINYDKGIIESAEFSPDSKAPEDMVEEVVEGISDEENGVGLLPADVTILSHEISGDILQLDFSATYRKMKAVDEILCRAAVVKNFIQIEGISYVKITIEGEDLLDSKGNTVGMMGSNTFLEYSGKDITAYQYTELELYFANKEGDKLVKEKRSVYYTSNSPIEKVVVEQLIRGPKEEGHYATLPVNTGILSVSQADGIAYVNLDQRFVSEALTIQEELPVYSIVNSLIDAGNVRQVQISVNGETKLTFRESMKLNQLYEKNMELVEEEAEEDKQEDSGLEEGGE